MKTLGIEKMEKLEGGSEASACFMVGLATFISLADPIIGWLNIYENRKVIDYCLNS